MTDPVSSGLVASLASPGGKVTGFTNFEFTMGGKWLEVLNTAVPSVSKVALIYNPQTSTPFVGYLKSIEASASSRLASILTVRGVADYRRDHPRHRSHGHRSRRRSYHFSGLFYLGQPRADYRRGGKKPRTPAVYPYRYFAADGGGLMSYGVNTAEEFRRAASYVDRILRGTSPGELPVQAPNKFELVINLKTANALGLSLCRKTCLPSPTR